MDFEKLKDRILYSNIMKELHSKQSPVRGYVDAGCYVRTLQRYVDTFALTNGLLDHDYCGVLALASVIGIPPYGKEGKLAIKELLGDAYDRKKISIARIEHIAGEPMPAQVLKDLESIEERSEDASNEARIVELVERTLEVVALLTKEEYEKMGGCILTVAILGGIKKDQDGILRPGSLLVKFENEYMARKTGPDEDRKKKVLENFRGRIMGSVTDEEKIEKIIGE